MAEFEVDITGDEIEVECPKCEGKGKIISSYYKAFDTTEKEWNEKQNSILCPMCNGDGTIMAIASDTIYVYLEPQYNEGYL